MNEIPVRRTVKMLSAWKTSDFLETLQFFRRRVSLRASSSSLGTSCNKSAWRGVFINHLSTALTFSHLFPRQKYFSSQTDSRLFRCEETIGLCNAYLCFSYRQHSLSHFFLCDSETYLCVSPCYTLSLRPVRIDRPRRPGLSFLPHLLALFRRFCCARFFDENVAPERRRRL